MGAQGSQGPAVAVSKGTAQIQNGQTNVDVSTSAFNATDVISTSYKTAANSGGALYVDNVNAGAGTFKIYSTGAVGNQTDVNWAIV